MKAFLLFIVMATLTLAPASPALAGSHASLGPIAKSDTGVVYVARGKEIAIYRQDGGGFVGRITNGTSSPRGLFVDAAGSLYVANQAGPDIAIYPRGRRAPSLLLSDGLEGPNSVAVDSSKTVYVADGNGAVVEYRAGQTHPFLTIPPYVGTSPGVFPTDIAVDGSGDVFMSAFLGSFGQDILEYTAGPSPSWQRLHLDIALRNEFAGVAIDRSGELVFAVASGFSSYPGGIFVYDVAQKKVVRAIGHQYSGYSAIRFDPGLNRLFAGGMYERRTYSYDYASGKFIRSIFSGTNDIFAIAAGPS